MFIYVIFAVPAVRLELKPKKRSCGRVQGWTVPVALVAVERGILCPLPKALLC